jgi:hypothetical protein
MRAMGAKGAKGVMGAKGAKGAVGAGASFTAGGAGPIPLAHTAQPCGAGLSFTPKESSSFWL